MAAVSNYVTVSRRPPDIEDYIDMMRRYRSWIIGPMFAGLVVSVCIAFFWPDTYVSTAMMQITPQQISPRLVAADYVNPMLDQLNQMQQEILSRGQLSELILKPSLNLYPKQRKIKPLDDIVEQMRNRDIVIQMVDLSGRAADPSKPYSSAFTISFRYPDRYIAQAVVRELTSKFIEQNYKLRTDQAKISTLFIDDELSNAKKTLQDMESKLTKWRMENEGKLPEQFQANWSGLQSERMEAQRLTDLMSQKQQQKMMLEQTIRNFVADQTFYSTQADQVFTGPGQMTVKNQRLVNLDGRLDELRMGLAAMQKQYGEKYPAISDVKAQIKVLEDEKAQLEKEESDAEAKAAAAPPNTVKVTNPQVQARLVDIKNNIETTKTELGAVQQDMENIVKAQAENNKRIAAYQQRIEESPIGQSQYEALMRDYNLAQQAYDGQVKKKEESETAANLEEHKAGPQLVPLDTASLPEQPVEPKRPVWAAVGTVMGLMIGVVLAAVKEMQDSSLKNLKDVRAYTNLPILSSVPLLENALLVRRKRRLFWLAWSAAFIFGTLAMCASMYYYYSGKS